MADWKKVVVSGSAISQLNNDAGYLTSVTAQNAFATASFDGIDLLADNADGTLNFASGSGQGLTISASAGNDTLTFGLEAVPNASLANSAITIAGTSTSLGGSITTSDILSGTNVVSGSSQVVAFLPAGTVSGSIQVVLQDADITGFTGANTITTLGTVTTGDVSAILPSGTVSGSALSSTTQGVATLTTNGVASNTNIVDLQTTSSPTFVGLTLTGDATIAGDLTVQGTASFQNTENLLVADRFVLFASGSNSTGDGGIVVQQGTQNVGELYGFDSGATRWGFTSSFSADGAAFTPDAFASAVVVGAGTDPNAAPGRYDASGNIFVGTDEEIWIYS